MPIIAPPPWTLHGGGLVMVAHFPESFVRQHGFLAHYQQTTYRGWVGAVMLVDYHTSGVGPYRELLFIPGLFSLANRTTFSISKIYVSTHDSIHNGIENWGIPKELADFSITTHPDGSKTYLVSQAGEPFFQVRVGAGRLAFPLNTNLMPGFRLIQQRRGELLLTTPVAIGTGRFASLSNLVVDSNYFPDIQQGTRLSAIAVSDFTMVFPVSEVVRNKG
jgi:Acetoacetate decarboxylase (ADC)